MSVLYWLDVQPEAEPEVVGTPEEKEARLLKALSLDKYMPASFLTSKLVSTFKGKPTPEPVQQPISEGESPINKEHLI